MSFTNPLWNDILAKQILILSERVRLLEQKLENREFKKDVEIKVEKENKIVMNDDEINEWIKVADIYKKNKKKL